jgi:hypothetical protein
MTEDEFKKEISEIKTELKKIDSNTYHPVWKSFITGMLSGMGSVLGVVIAVAVIGWILNTVGVIPALKDKVNSWQQTLDNFQRNR